MTVIYGLIGLGILVFFHELGHFTQAKICGVKVEAFSIGMGPVILHHKFHDCDWRLSLIPFGGYCAMKGEKDYQAALELGLKEIKGSPDSFYGVHPLKRLLIAFSGPFANLILGYIFFVIIALTGYTYFSAGTTVSMADEIYENISSPAHEAGMLTGDKILSVDDENVEDFSDIASYVSVHPDEDIVFKVLRDGNEILITVHALLDKQTGSGKVGIAADPDSVIKREVKGKGLFASLGEGFSETGKMLTLTFKSIGILFKGVKVTSAVSGPARITTMLGETVKAGFGEGFKTGLVSTLEFMALISISLFLTNLLPVPVLDGGLIIFSLVEFISGKKLNPKFLYYVQFVGIAFIALLAVLAISGDILYFIRK